MFWASNVPLRFRFAAVFQGGGIRGLFFPGHLVGLVRRGIEKIFVYAGASAGALIAVGIWAGLRPDELNTFLVSRCGYFGLVRSIFSVGDLFAIVATWIWAILLVSINFVLRILVFFWVPGILLACALLVPMNLGLAFFLVLGIVWLFYPQLFKLRPHFWLECYPGCAGKKFERLINDMILAGLERRGIHPKLIEDLNDRKGEFWPTFRDIWRLSHWVRLVNGVTGLEHPDYERVEVFYPELKEKRNELRFTSDPYSSNNVWQLVYGVSTHDPFFAPIFISTCCVDDRVPVLFNNIEERYWDIPIAHIVRASAGYPTVFRPKALKLDDKSKRYTDGGLMANFPAFAVNQALRRLFSRTNDKLPEDYKTIRTLPYGTIGLAVSDQTEPSTYIAVLRDVLIGGARERLEYELASTSPYFRLVRQATTGEPHFLNFFSVKPTLIEVTFEKAAAFIDGIQISSTVDLNPLQDEIERNLKGAIESCERLFPVRNGGYIRIHLFIESETRHGLFNKKAVLCKGRAIDQFKDIEISVTREFAGLIGLVRSSSFPLFCRIDLLQARRIASPTRAILGLTIDDTRRLPDDLNFCFVIPIFDYRNIRYVTGKIARHIVPELEDCIRLIDTGIEGPLIGAISIDGRSDEAKDGIEVLVRRIGDIDILPTLERYAWEIGCLVAEQVEATIGRPDLDNGPEMEA